MDERDQVREFLTSRRARLAPRDVGLPTHTGRRRVAGLRRDEVAVLSGMSSEYYARLERGQLAGVSDAVLEALARALRLDDAEQLHLRNLAHAANTPLRRARQPVRAVAVRASVQHLLDALVTAPGYVCNSRIDIIASNAAARALLSPVFEFARLTGTTPNTARFIFLDPTGLHFFPEWEKSSRGVVAALHASVGQNPYDKPLTDLIGELSSRSDVFRTLWARHDVAPHLSGTKLFRHPEAGLLELDFEVMPLPGDGRMTLAVFTAAPGSPAADCLALLSSLRADPVLRPINGAADSMTAVHSSTEVPPTAGNDSNGQ